MRAFADQAGAGAEPASETSVSPPAQKGSHLRGFFLTGSAVRRSGTAITAAGGQLSLIPHGSKMRARRGADTALGDSGPKALRAKEVSNALQAGMFDV